MSRTARATLAHTTRTGRIAKLGTLSVAEEGPSGLQNIEAVIPHEDEDEDDTHEDSCPVPDEIAEEATEKVKRERVRL